MTAEGGEPLVVVGTITRTHGVRGEVYVRADSDNPDRFVPPARFRTDHQRFPMLVLRQVREGPHGLIVEFAGVTSIELATELCGSHLMIEPQDRRPLDDREYWPDQLVGMDVRIGQDVVGRVVEVVLGSQDRLVIERGDGLIGEVPFVDALVPEVDLDGRWVRIEPPDGLFTRR